MRFWRGGRRRGVTEWTPDPDYPGWHGRVHLHGDTTLFFSALDPLVEGVYNVELVATSGAYDPTWEDADFDRVWAKEGEATGPGGTKAWGLALDMLTEAESLVRNQGGEPIFQISPATEQLMHIYSRFLPRLGYIRVAGDMLKVLR